jgi:hypothetical protein
MEKEVIIKGNALHMEYSKDSFGNPQFIVTDIYFPTDMDGVVLNSYRDVETLNKVKSAYEAWKTIWTQYKLFTSNSLPYAITKNDKYGICKVSNNYPEYRYSWLRFPNEKLRDKFYNSFESILKITRQFL